MSGVMVPAEVENDLDLVGSYPNATICSVLNGVQFFTRRIRKYIYRILEQSGEENKFIVVRKKQDNILSEWDLLEKFDTYKEAQDKVLQLIKEDGDSVTTGDGIEFKNCWEIE